MRTCRRQPGSLATGCSYLRLVQTKSRGGLISLGEGAVAEWGRVFPPQPKSRRYQALWLHLYLHPAACCPLGQKDLQLICMTVRVLMSQLNEWGGKKDLQGVRTEEELHLNKNACVVRAS